MKTSLTYQAHLLTKLANQIEQLETKWKGVVNTFRALPAGRYNNVTVYKVRRYKVKAHYRKEHIRIRIKL